MNVDQLLRPEELSDEELVRILTSLNVEVSYNNPRSYLLDVYKRAALPLPQRQRNSNGKLTNSTKSKSLDELDLFKSVKREQVPVTHIGDTKKMKLNSSVSSEAMDQCSDEYIPQVNRYVDSKPENSKRKLCADFADHIKRIKITP